MNLSYAVTFIQVATLPRWNTTKNSDLNLTMSNQRISKPEEVFDAKFQYLKACARDLPTSLNFRKSTSGLTLFIKSTHIPLSSGGEHKHLC